MLFLFSLGVAERPPVLERAVYSVYSTCLLCSFYQFLCVLHFRSVLRVGCGI